MTDIFHDFPINASQARVFETVSNPNGLNQWWTSRSSGQPAPDAEYELWFGPDYEWRATVTQCVPNRAFELEITDATDEWRGTRVGFRLESTPAGTQVQFYHIGWPEQNEHYRISSYCWAMYLRILKRYVEHGEEVPYESRLDV